MNTMIVLSLLEKWDLRKRLDSLRTFIWRCETETVRVGWDLRVKFVKLSFYTSKWQRVKWKKDAVSKRYQKIRNLEIIYISKSFKKVFYMWEIWKESEEDSSQKKLGYNECRQIYIVTLNSLFYLWKLYLYHQVILIYPSKKKKKKE